MFKREICALFSIKDSTHWSKQLDFKNHLLHTEVTLIAELFKEGGLSVSYTHNLAYLESQSLNNSLA